MGATASKVDGPLEALDADQVRDVVAGFGTQFAGAADKMREASIDGDYLAHASDDDLAIVFQECGLTKLQQSLLKQKLRKRRRRQRLPAAAAAHLSAARSPDAAREPQGEGAGAAARASDVSGRRLRGQGDHRANSRRPQGPRVDPGRLRAGRDVYDPRARAGGASRPPRQRYLSA